MIYLMARARAPRQRIRERKATVQADRQGASYRGIDQVIAARRPQQLPAALARESVDLYPRAPSVRRPPDAPAARNKIVRHQRQHGCAIVETCQHKIRRRKMTLTIPHRCPYPGITKPDDVRKSARSHRHHQPWVLSTCHPCCTCRLPSPPRSIRPHRQSPRYWPERQRSVAPQSGDACSPAIPASPKICQHRIRIRLTKRAIPIAEPH